jgi:hypothetical protein
LFRQGAGTVTVAFPSGRQSSAAVLAVDPTWDLAALEIGESLVAPAAISEESPRPGENLQTCGYGPDGRYLCTQGRALGYVQTAASVGHETLEVSGAAREGDSGGPVFNSRGELVAVVWGTDGRCVEGTYCGRIRKFLATCFGLRRLGPPSPPPDKPAKPGRQEPSPQQPSAPAGPVAAGSGRAEIERLQAAQAGILKQIEAFRPALQAGEEIRQQIGPLLERVGQHDRLLDKGALGALVKDVALPLIVEHAAGAAGGTALTALLPALGASCPPAAAGLAVGWLILRYLRARLAQRSVGDTAAPPDSPAGSKTSAPAGQGGGASVVVAPTRTVRDRQFVPIEIADPQLKALHQAIDRYVQQFPGAASMVKTIEAYAEQILSGMAEKRP